MTDEAHRSHYGIYETVHYEKSEEGELSPVFKYGIEKYIRDALPNATFIGFTGTPISNKEKQTTDIFGNIIDVYDMTQSIIDGSTVKLYYESRLAKVWTNEDVLAQIDHYYDDIEDSGQSTPDAIENPNVRCLSFLASLSKTQLSICLQGIFLLIMRKGRVSFMAKR